MILSSAWREQFHQAQAGRGGQKPLCFMTHFRRERLRETQGFLYHFFFFLKFLKIFNLSRFYILSYLYSEPIRDKSQRINNRAVSSAFEIVKHIRSTDFKFMDFVLTLYVTPIKLKSCVYFIFPFLQSLFSNIFYYKYMETRYESSCSSDKIQYLSQKCTNKDIFNIPLLIYLNSWHCFLYSRNRIFIEKKKKTMSP